METIFILKNHVGSVGRFRFNDPTDLRVRVVERRPSSKGGNTFLVEAVNGKGRTIVPSYHFEGVQNGGSHEPRALNLQHGNVWFR
jgi:hypothetical protein